MLVFLRRIDAKIDALGLDVRELKERVTGVELGQTSIWRGLAALARRMRGSKLRSTGCASMSPASSGGSISTKNR